MAKSIRSKRKRKLRAIKREKNYSRELERLKKMTEKSGTDVLTTAQNVVVALPSSASAASVPKYTKEFSGVLKDAESEKNDEEAMECKTEPKYDKKTKRDKDGHYPPWMNQRKIRKHKQTLKIAKVAKRKTKKKSAFSW